MHTPGSWKLKSCNQHKHLHLYHNTKAWTYVFLWHVTFLLFCAVTTDHHSQATSSRGTWRTMVSSTKESPLLATSKLWGRKFHEATHKSHMICSHRREEMAWTSAQIPRFLLNYQTMPHTTTGQTPATLLFNRKVRNKLPQLTPKVSDKQLIERDRPENQSQDEDSNYADTRQRAKPASLQVCQLKTQFSSVSWNTTSSLHDMIREPSW